MGIFGLGEKIKSSRSLFGNKNDDNDPNKLNNECIAKKSLKASKDLEDRMEEMQIEMSQMIQRLEQTLLRNIYESEHNIMKDISKLSDHVESMVSKKLNGN